MWQESMQKDPPNLDCFQPSMGKDNSKWITKEISKGKQIQTNIMKYTTALATKERSVPTREKKETG
jgi:hypothetical protein